MTMMNLVSVALGSALGGACRYAVSLMLNARGVFPWGTFGVNVVGSLLLGVLSGLLAQGSTQAAALRAFLVVGFCGGFTTFSTFSNEAFKMLENAQWGLFVLYAGGTLFAGLVAVALGYLIAGEGLTIWK